MHKQDDVVDLSNYNTRDKTTAIKKIVRSYELLLRGYEWSGNGDIFVQSRDALAGEEVINKAITLLQPFSEEANLITGKERQVFSRQKYDINSIFNATLWISEDAPAKNYLVIMTSFKAILQNIGDIILHSKPFIQSMVTNNVEEDIKKGVDF